MATGRRPGLSDPAVRTTGVSSGRTSTASTGSGIVLRQRRTDASAQEEAPVVVPHPERRPDPPREPGSPTGTAGRTAPTTHRFTRGLLLALLLSVPFWVLVGLGAWLISR